MSHSLPRPRLLYWCIREVYQVQCNNMTTFRQLIPQADKRNLSQWNSEALVHATKVEIFVWLICFNHYKAKTARLFTIWVRCSFSHGGLGWWCGADCTTEFGPGWDSNSQASDLWANHWAILPSFGIGNHSLRHHLLWREVSLVVSLGTY